MKTTPAKLLETYVAGFTVAYSVTESEVTTDTGTYTRYGVLVEKSDGEHAGFADIFPTRAQAVDFLTQLHRCQVTPTSLGDIVYDRLCHDDTVIS